MDTSNIQEVIARIYHGNGGDARRLPYTAKFDELYAKFRAETSAELTQAEFFRHLLAVSWKKLVSNYAKEARENHGSSPWGVLPVRGPGYEDLVVLFDHDCSTPPSGGQALRQVEQQLAKLGVKVITQGTYPEEGDDRTRGWLLRGDCLQAELARQVERAYKEPDAKDGGGPRTSEFNDKALLQILWKTWHESPVVADPKGDRLFRRFVDLSDVDPGWDEWAFVGTIRDERVVYRRGRRELPGVAKRIKAGQSSGDLVVGTARVQWARSTGDGPPGERFLGVPPNAGDRDE
jgi:hypothetical protein